jgi:hypothetical protein
MAAPLVITLSVQELKRLVVQLKVLLTPAINTKLCEYVCELCKNLKWPQGARGKLIH